MLQQFYTLLQRQEGQRQEEDSLMYSIIMNPPTVFLFIRKSAKKETHFSQSAKKRNCTFISLETDGWNSEVGGKTKFT